MKNGFLLPSQNQDVFFHHVSSGDTLSKIISEYFPDNTYGMDLYIQQVMADNPEVINADLIKPDQLLSLRAPNPNMCLAPLDQKESEYVKELWRTMDTQSQTAIKDSSPYYTTLSLGISGGGISMFTLEKTLVSNMSLLNGIPDEYQNYKQGKITKYEFDKLRKAKLDQYTRNVGPAINKMIHGDKRITTNFKLQPGRSLDATKSMTQHMDKLTKVSKVASRGGLVLTGVGLAASCYQISQADTQVEKNEIAVSTIAGTVAGTGVGIVAGIFLAATPIGWGIILAVGTASVLTGMATGEAAKYAYKNTKLGQVDIVDSLGINKVCN